MSRSSLIAGNWKMFKTPGEAVEFARLLVAELQVPTDREVVIAPAFPSLTAVAAVLRGSEIALAAQNVHHEPQGAFTGEVAAGMLRDAGCRYVIVGHSERRTYFRETDELINRKLAAALASGLKPILCIGETLTEREQDKTLEVIARQLKEGLKNVAPDDIGSAVVAYEPVWAIGTGRTASPGQAQEVHALIRRVVAEMTGAAVAEPLRILYGGSMKPSNAGELMSRPDIDGGLIGGASLQAKSFVDILRASA